MRTMEQDLDMEVTAADVLHDDELEAYCRKQHGKPSDVARRTTTDEGEPPW